MESSLLQSLFVIASTVLMIASFYPYLRDIIRKTTKPDLVTWFGWALLSGIATAAQFAEGASYSVVVPLLATFGNLAVVALGFEIGHSKFTRLDMLCLGFGLGAIFAWMITSNALLALYISIVADFVISIPTVVKAYKQPQTETPSAFFIFAGGAFFGLLSSSNAAIHNVLFPLYSVFDNLIIGSFALHRKIKKAKVARVR